MNSDDTPQPVTEDELAAALAWWEREQAYAAAYTAAVDRLQALGEQYIWQRLREQYQRGEKWG
jgi:hypothetical protein